MRKILLGTVAALAASSAYAADLPPAPAYKAPVMAPVAYTWTGFYIGINGGWGWGRSRFDFAAAGTSTGNFNTSGGLVGGTAGYNWQTGQFVLGVETDFDWANIKGSAPCPNPAFSCQTSDSWLGTARGRVGWTPGNVLFYVTGGAAYGDVKAAISGPVGFPGDKATKLGWTAGGGVEYMFTPNWTGKLEYLHVDLGSFDCVITGCSNLSTTNVKFTTEIIRAGVNYKF
jgi:outer membrane immunogenic protein